MKKKTILSIIIISVIALILFFSYRKYASTTKIGTLNFPDFTVEKFIRSNNNSFVKINSIELDELTKLTKYDIVMVRIHGDKLTKDHLEAIKKAINKGVVVISTESDNPEINSLSGRELKYISLLLENGSVKNYRSMFNYMRKKIDKKKFFNKEYYEPVLVPNDYFFHLGEDQFFSTYSEYQKFYEESGLYKENAPRVVLLSGNINMQNSNEEHMVALINSLQDRGLNVYPILSFGFKKLSMIRDVKPNIIINRPHGRLLMGGADRGMNMLRELNVPLMAPVTVSDLYENWINDEQGMAAGGMMSMSVVLPELDGAIAPYAIAAQFERGSHRLFDAIPMHTDKFCSLVYNYTKLQQKENKDKKIAVYYYKGMGKGTISASDIEGVASLYNTLKMLRDNGYNVTGLPDSQAEFERMVQKQGSVLGPYALGAYDEFIKTGNPEFVHVDTLKQWANRQLPKEMMQAVEERYGAAPGEYMGYEQEGQKYISIARLQFGNVVILPQPLPAVGDDIDKIVHGVKGAPAYPYIASYMWTRNGFKADAIIHFGTHGSLEFIPGKQIALSDYDWSDALIGDMPHFYIYTVSNVGEGIIAKRRSYATLVSHLTAPFMKSDLYDDFLILEDNIHKMEYMEEGEVKQRYRQTITEMSKKQNILSALNIDSTRTMNDEEIERVHIYLAEIKNEKVNDGLYTLGNAYNDIELDNTTRLVSYDPIRYALANLDASRGKISYDDIESAAFLDHNYNRKTEQIIAKALNTSDPSGIFKSLVTEEELSILENEDKRILEHSKMMEGMMQMAFGQSIDSLPKFLDEEGNIIGRDIKLSEMSPMEKMRFMSKILDNDEKAKNMSKSERMAYAKELMKEMEAKEKAGEKIAIAEENTEEDNQDEDDGFMMNMMAQQKGMEDISDEERKKEEMISVLSSLRDAILNVSNSKNELYNSTRYEQEALIDGLNGGFIEPSSGGDPIINPKSVPSGKNFYSINPETTPSVEAWQVGKKLAENILVAELEKNGKYPEKISFTLWSSDFISSEGATIAQILYLLGVEPLRDGLGYIRSLRLIPAEKLGRPRIDVVVQTSGQLRDIAASRLELISRAIVMAGEDNSDNNYVKKGFEDAERMLLDKGFSPADARKFSRERVFGGINGNYGTGIMGMVEKGDSWEERSEIAERYINNMSAMYSSNGGDEWGQVKEGVFEAALLNTSVVVQPRAGNTWGPVSLDHVYEFMGGLSAAVEHVTGNDPTGYFNDFRNSNHARVQELKEAVGVESNSTVFNPKYINEMMKGEASSMNVFAEAMRNTYGWNVMKPSAIDDFIWDKYYQVYVKDEYNLDLKNTFEEKNPYALQEMTAVMLETVRKGLWDATPEQIKDISELHAELVKEHNAACSGFVCDNAKLKDYISSNLNKNTADDYKKEINDAREVKVDDNQNKNVVLKKDEQTQKTNKQKQDGNKSNNNKSLLYILLGLLLFVVVWLLFKRRSNN